MRTCTPRTTKGTVRPLHCWQSTLHLSRAVRCGHMLAVQEEALRLASEKGHTETVKAVVESGADVHAKDQKSGYGRPPLQRWAKGFGFCSDGAMRAHWLGRWTALHHASGGGHTETVDCLVKTLGADLHDKDKLGYGFELRCAVTPRHSGCLVDQRSPCRWLNKYHE
jgi:ankyrin repeat protein